MSERRQERIWNLQREDAKLLNEEKVETESPDSFEHLLDYYVKHPTDYERIIMGTAHIGYNLRKIMVDRVRVNLDLKYQKATFEREIQDRAIETMRTRYVEEHRAVTQGTIMWRGRPTVRYRDVKGRWAKHG